MDIQWYLLDNNDELDDFIVKSKQYYLGNREGLKVFIFDLYQYLLGNIDEWDELIEYLKWMIYGEMRVVIYRIICIYIFGDMLGRI